VSAIRIRNLTKIFRIPFRRQRVIAVNDLSLDVQPGQVYGLLGPNGSGKSTTMKIVLGLIPPTSGSTEIFGRGSSQVESREEVGFLPENPYFYKYLTGEETLGFFGRICGLKRDELAAKTDELLKLVGLEGARDRRLGGYSKGMLHELISIENQTELIVENAAPQLLSEVESLITRSGARVVETRKPQTTLERYFIEVTSRTE
jgi:ABC-2 type transport system ATP-binding protein